MTSVALHASPTESGSRLDRATRGLLAGAAGGLVVAGAKLLGELVFPPRAPGEQVPPAVFVSKVVEALSGSPLLTNKELLATQAFHWTFSIGVGAIVERSVEATRRFVRRRVFNAHLTDAS